MAQTITIQVTAEDIANGARRNCKACPIALAASRHECFSNAILLEVGAIYISWYDEKSKAVRLPEIAIEFIRDFDKRRDVKPFEFEAILVA